jgi:tetratricopeptide (TPR) repeat protein
VVVEEVVEEVVVVEVVVEVVDVEVVEVVVEEVDFDQNNNCKITQKNMTRTRTISTLNQGVATIAQSTIPLGTIVLNDDEPIVYTVEDCYVNNHCHSCLSEITQRHYRCNSCKFTHYCSPQCFEKDVNLVHKRECLALRRMLKQASTFNIQYYTQSIRLATRYLFIYNENVLLLNEFVAVSPSVSQHEDISNLSLLIYSLVNNYVTLITPDKIYHLLCQFRANNIGICNSDMNCVGSGFYRSIAKLNHSCIPNAAVYFNGTKATVRSLRPIHTNEQVTISYIELAQSTNSRRLALSERYHFMCSCDRCEKQMNDDDQLLYHNTTLYSLERELEANRLYEEALMNEEQVYSKLTQAFKIYKDIFGEKHERLVDVCSRLSHLCVNTSLFSEAFEYAEQCTSCFEMCYPDLYPLLGVHYSMLAKLSDSLEKSNLYKTRAQTILKHWE